MECVKVYSPATVANVSCGFDIMGFALELPGDVIEVRRTNKPGLHIINLVEGLNIPTEAHKNTTTVAMQAMLDELEHHSGGFVVTFHEKIWPGSGVGSSSASAAAGVFALNELLNNPFERRDLVRFAMEGERAACGAAHADNVAPALLGGFVLIRDSQPLDLVSLHYPKELHAAVVLPEVVVRTEDARNVLPKDITLQTGIKQWAHVGALVAALAQENWELLSRSIHDFVAEPARKTLIPHFNEARQAAMQAGALGCGISGSGPAIFSLTRGRESAHAVALAKSGVFKQAGLPCRTYVSSINPTGVRVLKDNN